MIRLSLQKSKKLVTNTIAASKYMSKRTRICINGNPPFQTSLHRISKVVFFRLIFFFRNKKKYFQETTFIWFFKYCKTKKNFGAIRKVLKFCFFLKFLSFFSKKNFLDRSEIFFCIAIHKKLNKSCSLNKIFLYRKKRC